jgi:tRNA G10  N-methylase Trm11
MAEYISTFTTGFSGVITVALKRILPSAKVISVFDGLIHYEYSGKATDINRAFIFNNNYSVIKKYRGKELKITRMVLDATKLKSIPATQGTFRVRYSVYNQFVSMDKSIMKQIENKISELSGCKVDRVNPQSEYWFIIRSENVGFFCMLLKKREHTEKNLKQGELRPEFAYLLCCIADIEKKSTVFDPFAGHGSIPEQISKHFQFHKLMASDNDSDKIKSLKKRINLSSKKSISIDRRDALDMSDIPNDSVDVIITDPPWGYYEDIDDIQFFYHEMLSEFKRVLNPIEGCMVILSARKNEFESAVNKHGLKLKSKIDTLVNGKKASVYIVENLQKEIKEGSG